MSSVGPMQGVALTGVAQPRSGVNGGPGDLASGSDIGNAAVASTGTPSGPTRGAEELRKLVVDMQTRLSGTNANLVFSVDQDSGRSVVKVTERTTNEVIWQFPTDQALQVSKELGRYLGVLVNRTV